jgi:hypothetical protein
MDVQNLIRAKRESAGRVRRLAERLSGDDRIRAFVFAAELESQADVIEDQLIAPWLPEPANSNAAQHAVA